VAQADKPDQAERVVPQAQVARLVQTVRLEQAAAAVRRGQAVPQVQVEPADKPEAVVQAVFLVRLQLEQFQAVLN
jgi:hypothetical protein